MDPPCTPAHLPTAWVGTGDFSGGEICVCSPEPQAQAVCKCKPGMLPRKTKNLFLGPPENNVSKQRGMDIPQWVDLFAAAAAAA